jgi:hypothetical protein
MNKLTLSILLFTLAGVALTADRDQDADVASAAAPSHAVVEIRSYNLKPGTRERFHGLFVEQAWPLLRRAEMDVVAFGPSMHDENSYFLMRSFSGVEERQAAEDAFYGSKAWLEGPRQAVLDCIESYTTVVVQLDAGTISGLRKLSGDVEPAP